MDSNRVQAEQHSFESAVSTDGRYVAFLSDADNLVSLGSSDKTQLFLRDMVLGTTTLVSIDTSGNYAEEDISSPDISGNGRYVVFHTTANDLVTGFDDKNFTGSDVFVRDMWTQTTSLVSRKFGAAPNVTADGSSSVPAISDDGNRIVFQSAGLDIVENFNKGTNSTSDVYVHDQSGNTAMLVSQKAGGGINDGGGWGSLDPSISPDGQYVAFVSMAHDLVSGMNGNEWNHDVYRRNLQTSTTIVVSRKFGGTELEGANGVANTCSISKNGRYVAFDSNATDLIFSDTNSKKDIFLFDCDLGTMIRASVSSEGVEGNDYSGDPSVSNSGKFVVFTSPATNFVNDLNGNMKDIFRHNIFTRETELISTGVNGQGNNNSDLADISGDGATVVFTSRATNLIEGDDFLGDLNGLDDIFRRGP